MPIPTTWPATRWVGRITALVVLACTARALWLLSGAWYASDDVVNLAYARASSLDGNYLGRSVFGEFEPGLRLVDWVVARTTPVARWPAVVIEMAAFVAVLALVAVVIDRLAGATWWTPVMVGLVGWSVVATATVAWWSAALTYLVASAFGLLSVLAVLDRVARRGRHRAAVAVVSLAVCVSLFPGGAAFPLFAVLLCALFRPEGRGWSGAVRGVVLRWRLWVALAVPVAAVAGVTALGSYDTGSVAGPGALASFVWGSWSGTIAPALFGLPPEFLSHVTVGEELAVLVVGGSIAAFGSAWRAWVAVAVPTVAVLLAHGVARLANLGPAIEFIRSDLLPIELMVAVAVPLAFGRMSGTFTGVDATPRAWWVRWRDGHAGAVRTGAAVVLVVGTAAYVVLVGVATPQVPEVQQVRLARSYEAAFAASWAAAERSRPSTAVERVIVPYPVSISTEPDTMYPYDTTAADLGMFVPGARFTTAAPGPDVDAVRFPSGRLAPARVVPGSAVDPLPAAVFALRSRPVAGGSCLATGPRRGTAVFVVHHIPFFDALSLGRRVSFQPFLRVSVSGDARAASVASAGTLAAGDDRLAMGRLATPPDVVVTVRPHADVCLRRLEVEFVGTAPEGAGRA